jgi:hypothetical protein
MTRIHSARKERPAAAGGGEGLGEGLPRSGRGERRKDAGRGRVLLPGLAAMVLVAGTPLSSHGQQASPWSWDEPVSEETLPYALPVIQERLAAAGCYIGGADGRLGPMTVGAIAAFQEALGIRASPVVSEPLIDAVLNRLAPCERPGMPMPVPDHLSEPSIAEAGDMEVEIR